jgi:hypothetical protein
MSIVIYIWKYAMLLVPIRALSAMVKTRSFAHSEHALDMLVILFLSRCSSSMLVRAAMRSGRQPFSRLSLRFSLRIFDSGAIA